MKAEIVSVLQTSPRLKAKEIAKKICRDRKHVNAFLHQHTDFFVQNDDFEWSVLDSSEIEIKLLGEPWVDAESFENSLLKVPSPLDASEKHVVFLLSKDCRVLLEPACLMLALCNQLLASGREVTIDFSDCGAALSYFDRIGFFDSLGQQCVVLPQRPAESKAKRYKGNSRNVVEFGLIGPSQGREDLSSQDKALIGQLIDRFVDLVDNSYDHVATVIFSELIGNIKRHSQTQLQGIAGLQKYSGRTSHIQAMISDSGVGIATTLKTGLQEHYPDLYKMQQEDDFDLYLVEKALTDGEVSRFGKGHGLGFGITTTKAMKFDASLSVRQEFFSIKFIYRDQKLVDTVYRKELSRILGTHLCFDFNID